MRFIIFCIVLCFESGVSFSQIRFSFPAGGSTVSDFVPKGWKILDSATGDINLDGQKDAILALESEQIFFHRFSKEPTDTASVTSRMLLILLSQPNSGSLVVHYSSGTFIPYRLSTWEPLEGISVRRPGIVEMSFGHQYPLDSEYGMHVSYKFRFQAGKLVLIGADFRANLGRSWDYEDLSYNFITGRRSKIVGNEETDTKSKPAWRSFQKKTILLSDMGEPFSIEIDEDQIAL
ncbi:MAG: hypothetical protein EOO53_21350 [Gammaproteobacteria bacterium]|nr:MAG: hypothetical protein EOO53_21350 [Gammaproteobacteria bacterium]